MSETRKTWIRGGETGKRLKGESIPGRKFVQVQCIMVNSSVCLGPALKGYGKDVARGEAKERGRQRPGYEFPGKLQSLSFIHCFLYH